MERPAPGGDCVAHAPDGRVVFVRGALPGERVRARVTDENRRFLRADTVGRVVSLLRTGSARRARWPCRAAAAAATGSTRRSPAARELKGQVLREQLMRLGGFDPGPDATVHGSAACGGRARLADPGAGLGRAATARGACCATARMPSSGCATARSPTRSSSRPERGARTAPRRTACATSRRRGLPSLRRPPPARSSSTARARLTHQRARPSTSG